MWSPNSSKEEEETVTTTTVYIYYLFIKSMGTRQTTVQHVPLQPQVNVSFLLMEQRF